MPKLPEGRQSTWTLILLIFAFALLAGAPLPLSAKSDSMTLKEANERWAGARCRSRQSITLKNKKAKEGWSRSDWLFWDEDGGNQRARLWFTDAEVVRDTLGSRLAVGTEFIATGWREEESDNNIVLELELVSTGSRVKVYYWDSWVNRVPLSRLRDFEQWARFDLFELTSVPSEQLVDTVETPAVQGPTTAYTPTPVAGTNPAAMVAPALSVLAASVEPSRVSPGDQINLVVIYSVEGVPAGMLAQVREKRSILRSGTALTSLDAVAHQATGTHRSSQPLRLPTTLEAGVYELKVSVEVAGARAEGSALFEVSVFEN